MVFRGISSRWKLVLVVPALAVLVGCAAASLPAGSPMMGGSVTATVGDPGLAGSPMMGGGGMMNAQPGYTYSRASCSAPTGLPGAILNVMLGDRGMTRMMGGIAPLGTPMMLQAVPAEAPAGQVSLVVSNMGWRTHELLVLPLATGTAAGARIPGADGKVDETGSLGEASNSCSEGAGDGVISGAVGWITVTLTPGRYEVLCNLQNHYADGMYQEIVVT